MAKPKYPTRAEFEGGALTIEAVPKDWLLNLMTGALGHRLDRWFVRRTGLSFISWQAARARGIAYQPSLLLTTVGRKSGKKRTVVLPYVVSGNEFIVVASNAGRARSPAWVANLIAEPLCTVVVNRAETPVSARVAVGNERERLIGIVAKRRPQVFNYEQHCRMNGRQLEVIALQPRA